MYSESYIRLNASSRTYSKIAAALEGEYGILQPCFRGRCRIDTLMEHIAAVVREKCRQAAVEAARRTYDVANENLPSDPNDGL